MVQHDALTRFGEQRMNTLCLHFEQAYSRMDEAAIHDLRVSVRRAISLLGFLSFLYDEDAHAVRTCEKCTRKLKRSLKTLNGLRDTQVLLRHLKQQGASSPFAVNLIAGLSSQETALKESLQQAMDAWRLPAIRRKIKKLLQTRPKERPELELKTGMYLRYLTQRLHESVQCCQAPDGATCHRLRIRLKQYRYFLELLEQGYGIRQILLGAVRQWQNDLGILQDRRVLLECARQASDDTPDAHVYIAALETEITALLQAVQEEALSIRFETQLR